jgi:hypothetical protein
MKIKLVFFGLVFLLASETRVCGGQNQNTIYYTNPADRRHAQDMRSINSMHNSYNQTSLSDRIKQDNDMRFKNMGFVRGSDGYWYDPRS